MAMSTPMLSRMANPISSNQSTANIIRKDTVAGGEISGVRILTTSETMSQMTHTRRGDRLVVT